MAYLTSRTAGGKRYFYLSEHISKTEFATCREKILYRFGNAQIALERLSLWILDNSFTPKELIELGITIDDIKNWKEKIEKHMKGASLWHS
ncbi:hypothetical protein [Bacillus cereus group sp. BfR-BA-01319]|uniref:hypothetical protein n=1 Tax=Bacillus cereus group sp. BfR-BA-01319 TaxID=2920296 RepID=UPI001F565BC3|nr:hypothetical protein [Bacillus cereus group sp. BfR-BA-01319]MDA2526367.1 hypothetical protein [Bacillus cereus]